MILAVTALLRLQDLCPALLHLKGVDNVSHVLGLALFRAWFQGRHGAGVAAGVLLGGFQLGFDDLLRAVCSLLRSSLSALSQEGSLAPKARLIARYACPPHPPLACTFLDLC